MFFSSSGSLKTIRSGDLGLEITQKAGKNVIKFNKSRKDKLQSEGEDRPNKKIWGFIERIFIFTGLYT